MRNGSSVGPDLAGTSVLVVGGDRSGFAAADALAERGASVLLVDASDPGSSPELTERLQILDVLGVEVRLGPEHTEGLPADSPHLVIVGAGYPVDPPILTAALAQGTPIWSAAELAWRLRPEGAPPWLTITGSAGVATTAQVLAAMLRAADLRVRVAEDDEHPVLEAVLDPEPVDVVVAGLSSTQLRWSESISPLAAACLAAGEEPAQFAKVYENTRIACVYNVEDPRTEDLVREADVIEGARAIGFTVGVPALSMIGLVEDVIADRAFVDARETTAAELGTIGDLAVGGTPPPELVQHALAAAALARAVGIPPVAVRDGLRDIAAAATHRE